MINQGDELVVDSRLIAVWLGLDPKSVVKTIDKYLGELQHFGQVRFEIAAITGSVSGRPYQQRFCYLNENQATFLMSLSKNTEQVVDCKIQLVQAFCAAKKLITTTIPVQNDRIRELELRVQLADLERQNLRQRDTMITLYGTELRIDRRPPEARIGRGAEIYERGNRYHA